MFFSVVSKTFTKVFGSRNDRLIKTYTKRVAQVNALEPQVCMLTDAQLKAKTQEFKDRLAKGEGISEVMPEALAVGREAMDRAVGIRNIFNPAHVFDASRLPDSVRRLYQQVQERIAATPEAQELGHSVPVPPWQQVDIPNEIYEAVRELYPTSRPPFRARPFDVQLIGGMVLSEGKISEMKTGEGKTIVAPLACYVAALEGLQCHVVTVNDYLVQRDRDWVFPFYYHLGLTVGAIHPYHMQTNADKQLAYQCNVVYGTNSELGFDYLRDNMKLSTVEQVQKHRDFCIIDEVDSILIDEARTPLIISGPAHEDVPRYGLADATAAHLIVRQREWDAANEKVQKVVMRIKGLEGDIRNTRDKAAIPPMKQEIKDLQEQLPQLEGERDRHTQYYEVEMEKKASHLTHQGVAEAQKVANIGSFYVGNNMDFPHLLENALRAHVVYKRDKDYVVQQSAETREQEVIIVDEFTGRLMIGRQWSDGLHQAVEAKEKVKIKQETQTLATVTIQNFFKLYKRLAGMTGTAITEATEFNEIYQLDVVCIPTNVGVMRSDRDDLIFLSEKDKWNAILDEIKRMHDIGRPVLVGTTSVENSEMLSQLLQRKYNIKHEVLNAKQHEREAHIVEHAGELGAVMIATNMAGRGTDIKLTPVGRDDLVRHWQVRNLLSRDAKPGDDDEAIVNLSYRHQARTLLGFKPKDMEAMSDEELRLKLLRLWVQEDAFVAPEKAAQMSAAQCEDLLDSVPGFLRHRLTMYKHIEQMGGLHIVGTERHEARRIDNQLRGRSGRQGDRGSSRFFISLEDDLMKLFANKTMLAALSKLGMKEGDAIEHRWLTRAVEKAQRKVEERNYEIRKNLLEYDEVMEYQRNDFYGLRQKVLEGQGVDALIFDYISDATADAVDSYLDDDYVPAQIAEWVRQNLDVSIDPGKLTSDDMKELQERIRSSAGSEITQTIDVTIGEYMSDDAPPEEWDLRGLSSWAMSRFSVDLKQNQLREMNVAGVKAQLTAAALDLLETRDLSGLAKFLDPLYAAGELANWGREKFGVELKAEELQPRREERGREGRQRVADLILKQARELYSRREAEYPAQFAVDMTFQAAQQDGRRAAEQLAYWTHQRYELDWTPEVVSKMTGTQLQEALAKEGEAWLHGGKLEAQIDQVMHGHRDAKSLAEWAARRFAREVTPEQLAGDSAQQRSTLLDMGRAMLRSELTQLERFVLLQILDHAWKDHLYAMDQLKDSVNLHAYAERDPRIMYKREGATQFQLMHRSVRDRVTGLIFRARLTPSVEMRSVYQQMQAEHPAPGSAPSAGAAAAAAQGTAEQRADMEAAERASGGEARALSRKQRRAAAAQARHEQVSKVKDRKKRSR